MISMLIRYNILQSYQNFLGVVSSPKLTELPRSNFRALEPPQFSTSPSKYIATFVAVTDNNLQNDLSKYKSWKVMETICQPLLFYFIFTYINFVTCEKFCVRHSTYDYIAQFIQCSTLLEGYITYIDILVSELVK